MTCEHAVDLIVDSLMDTLDDEQRRELNAHLESCASCAAEAKRMGALWKDLGELHAPPAAPHAALSLGRRLAAAGQQQRYAPLLRLAAAVALLVLGGAGGYVVRGGGPAPSVAPTGASTFLFLVRGQEPQGPLSGDSLVSEYQAWASSLAAEGRLVGANKLTDEPGRWIAAPSAGDTRTQSDVSGYFLVSASGYAEALEIAGSSPHIRYGGTFEIRQVDPIN
jgi:anti-sigma factor RsiW